jgi:hypothetical protein
MSVVVLVGMLVLGAMLLANVSQNHGFEQPGGNFALYFMAFWLGLVVVGIVYNLRNVVSGNIPPTEVIDVIEEDDEGDLAQKLRQIRDLRNEGLITESEYQKKRQSLLDRLG